MNGIVSLFSGAGGLDLGFHQAGFEILWANEFDKEIAPSFQNHFKGVPFCAKSICDVDTKEIPRAIGVIGGPPCQSWSEAGARRGIKDARGQLFYEYVRVIRSVRPLFFVAENVHGIVHRNNIESFNFIVELFSELGYKVNWELLNANKYGVPQDRKRVFIVGYHDSIGKTFEFPEPVDEKVNLRTAIGDLAKLKLGTRKIKNHDITDTGFSPIFMSRNRVRGWDETSYTILACDRHIPFHPQAPKMVRTGNGEMRKFIEGQEHKYRRLSVRECARIQTFPDNYEFIYNHVRTGYKMVGNAVPVNLAYHIAEKIKADI